MADISQDLQKILDAIYGEEVRGSIYHAISLINDVSEVILTTGTDITAPTDSSEGYFTGSLYLNLDTYELWKCVGTNAWQSLGILKGATGENGNKWYRGLAVSGKAVLPTIYPTGIANANANDCYLNPSEGAIYHCVTGGDDTTATWSYDFTMTGGGGGGSIVTWTQIQGSTGGAKIAEINIDGSIQEVYAPEGGGGMLPYLYIDSEAGATVTVNQPDGTVITPTAAGSGHWECELTGGYGTYTIHSVLSGQGDATQSLAVDTVKEYHVTDTHYDFTINVTAPSGSTVRIVGGGETYTGTGTGSPQAFAVHTPSTTYTVTATQIMDGNTKTDEATVTSAATSGGSTNVTLSIDFGTINVTVAADFVTAGSTITCVNGGTSCTPKTAASTLIFRVPTTGTWTISGSVSGTPYSVEAEVTSLGTPVSVALQTTTSVTITLHSAIEDTVTFTDASGVTRTEVFTSGESSKTVTIAIMPSGSNITFASSVAYDPSNLDGSHYYSKTVNVTTTTTDIYIMPDNCYYWWGYINNMEDAIAANGWSVASGCSMASPTKNTNDMFMTASGSQFILEAINHIVPNGAIVKALMDCTVVYSGGGTVLEAYPTKAMGDGSSYIVMDGFNAVSSIALKTITLSQDGYVVAGAINSRAGHVYAIWIE